VHREIKENLAITSVRSAELNAVSPVGPMFREGVISFGKPGVGEANLRRQRNPIRFLSGVIGGKITV